MSDQKLIQPVLDAFVACGVQDVFLKKAILANMQKECGLIPKEENLNYTNTSNDRIRKIFGSRVSTITDDALNAIKADPQKFAELVYGSGNAVGRSMGNVNPGDGWTYRGRGYIQLTGKDNYRAFDAVVPENLLETPDLVATKYPLLSAAWFFHKNGLHKIADQGATDAVVTSVTKRVNGGTIGLADRIKHFKEYYNLLK